MKMRKIARLSTIYSGNKGKIAEKMRKIALRCVIPQGQQTHISTLSTGYPHLYFFYLYALQFNAHIQQYSEPLEVAHVYAGDGGAIFQGAGGDNDRGSVVLL